MTYRELLRYAEAVLQEAQIAEAAADAWILFEYVTGIDRTHYFLRSGEECPRGMAGRCEELLKKRAGHVPVQYITGVQEFMGLPFLVEPCVLIPRQDTELLVLEAERRIAPGARVLDLCTGSGCIAVSLKKRMQIDMLASDLSDGALAVARKNAQKLGADVSFAKSDLFAQIQGRFDCIVSNPPYIARGEIDGLMPEVRAHEPRMALDGGEDGLDFYRRIICEAGAFLKPGGWLLFEIGADQGQAAAQLFAAAGFCEIEVQKDLAGLDRVAGGRLWEVSGDTRELGGKYV